MGQKVHPVGFRLARTKTGVSWQSSWFANKKNYPALLLEDKKIRDAIEKKLSAAGIVRTKIERFNKRLKITLIVARPGLVIGRGGKELEVLKKLLTKILPKSTVQKQSIDLQVEEFKSVDLSAKLIAEKIAYQIAKRMPYRRVAISAMERSMSAGASGVKIIISGRINGAEISRREKFFQGIVPLSTLKANIDYHECPSLTRSGYVGVKVYVTLA